VTNFTICFVVIAVAIVLLVALNRSDYLRARIKLPGVDFSLHARNRKR
jgi:hypothetical protein